MVPEARGAKRGRDGQGQCRVGHPTEGTLERVWDSVLFKEVMAGLQGSLIIHLKLAVINFFGM